MARGMASSLLTLTLTLALTVMVAQSASVGFQGMEENCILSFVVPRDKMKSSCELDSKVNRRINAMEMKVNIYKQQVAELHGQLDKQRLVSMEKLDSLDKQVKESTVNADMSFLIERRLALLEKEFEQLHEDVVKVKGKPAPSTNQPGNFNAVDNNPVTLPNLVRSMVQSEVKTLMVNFSRQIENYVQEQILLYNRVFNMIPKPQDAGKAGRTTFSLATDASEKGGGKQDGRQSSSLGEEILKDFDKVKATLDDTGDKIAKHVGNFVKNITNAESGSSSDPVDPHPKDITNLTSLLNDTVGLGALGNSTNLEMVLGDDLQDTNESYSGDHSDRHSVSQDKLTSLDKEIPVSSSRISHGAEEDSGVSKEVDGKAETDRWKEENMVRDQQTPQSWSMEDRLKNEITSMLYSPLAEVMTLLEKQNANLEGQMATQREEAQEVTSTLRAQIKALEQHVLSTAVKVDSLTKGFQDMREVLDTVNELEATVGELKKNLSAAQTSGPAIHELDEQVKKVKKLERLIGVYQHSLDHYRNETKLEYREIRTGMEKEKKSLRSMTKELEKTVTNRVETALTQINNTYLDRFRNINDQIRIHEDNAMLMQIDINNIDRKVSGKSSRSDKEIDDLRDSIRQATNKHREFRRRLESIEQEQNVFRDQLNVTAKDVFDLKTEVKLSVSDEWLPMTFEYDLSRTDCFGDQFVRKSPFKEAKLVGVVLCSPMRYKIFLANSSQSTFLNIGDTDGLGEDHCEFVGAKQSADITLSPFKPAFSVVRGYARSFWGDAPALVYLNAIKPSPRWYECGVMIP